MGGHAHGEVASRLVKEVVLEAVAEGAALIDSVLKAHRAVALSAAENSEYEGMGSTVVAVKIENRQARFVWVGDSRAYLWRAGKLKVLTRDHSYLERLLAADHISEEEARNHPRRNIVTQILGIGEARPDERRVPLRQDDWLLLCSDGLNDELTDAEIAAQLNASPDTETAVENLIEAALTHGGRDNISVIVLQKNDNGENDEKVKSDESEQEKSSEHARLDHLLPVLLGVIGGLLFAFVLWWLK